MIDLDVRTIFFISMLLSILSLVVISLVWRHNHRNYRGLDFWVADYVLQVISVALLYLRGRIPDALSVTLPNLLILSGFVLLLMGFERFLGKKSHQLPNYLLMAVFIGIQSYFSLVHSNLEYRTFMVNAGIVIFGLQGIWILRHAVNPEIKRVTSGSAIALFILCLVTIGRILEMIFTPYSSNDVFKSGSLDMLFYVAQQLAVLYLTFNLILLVNHRLTEEIKQSETELLTRAKLLDNVNDALFLHAENGRLYYVNDTATRLLGYTREEILSHNLFDMVIPEPPEKYETVDRQMAEKGEALFENAMYRRDGSTLPMEVHNQRFEINGQIRILSLARDISARNRVLERLRSSEERFSKAFRSNPEALAITLLENAVFLEVNDAFSKITGYSRADTVGHSSRELNLWVSVEDRAAVLSLINRQGRALNFETGFRTKAGEIRTWLLSAEPIEIDGKKCIIWLNIDITERKKAETALLESEEKYRTLYESMAQGVIYQNAVGEVISVNAAARRILNVSQTQTIMNTQVIGSGSKAIHEDGTEFLARDHPSMQALRTGQPVNDVIMGILDTRSDSYIWISISAIPQFRPGEGKPFQVFVTFDDITALKKAELMLKQSEEVFRYNFDLSPVGAAIVSPDYRFLRVNDEFCRMLGYTAGELTQKTFAEVTYSPDLVKDLEQIKALIKGDITRYNADKRYVRKDGSLVWGNVSVNAVKDASGNLLYLMPRILDISERKKIEESLKESESKLRLILDSAAEAIYGIDIEGYCTFCNPACIKLLGYQNEMDLLGQRMHEIIHYKYPDGSDYPMDDCLIYQAFRKGEGCHVENEVVWKADGSSVPVEYWSYPQFKDGKVIGSVVTFVDISARREAEARVIEVETLSQLNKAKSELLANVSHELRTPLSSIKGFIETLLETDVKWSRKEQMEFLRSANIEADRLTFLIRDLLDMSRLDSGRMVLDKSYYSIDEILGAAGNVIGVLTANHHLLYNVEPGLPEISVDKIRIAQVLTNLVENATKFSPQGSSIKINVSAFQDKVVFSVEDQGEGMTSTVISNLFNRFFQAERVVSGKTRGTGLGLAICKGIIESHGGTIWAESEPGKGSKFFFTLPLKTILIHNDS